jgi:hypothetical protein
VYARFPRAALILMLAAALAACRGNPPAPATITPGADRPTFTPAPPASATSAPSSTSAPTASQGAPTTEAATQTPVVDATAGTPEATLPPTSAASAAPGTDSAEFLADVTAPDGADFAPGEIFTKTWQLRNNGTTTWNAAYSLVYVSGEQMGDTDAVPLLAEIAPGATADLSVRLTAPTRLDRYTGFWMLRNSNGQVFGIGPEANQPIYVQIDVVATASGSPAPTGQAGPISVSAAQMAVEQAEVSGVCPQTLTFSGSFTSQGAGQVTYVLEMQADQPGFVFTPPDTGTSTFTDAGPRTFAVAYDLQFTDSVSGQVWLRILTPNSLESNKVNFALTCAAP